MRPGIMPGFGRGGMLPGFGLLPPPGRGADGRSPPERSPPGRSPPGRGPRSLPGPPPGRGAPGRGAGAPEPTPNGLLPTRGVRGPGLGPPGLGPCGFGGTTEPPPDCGAAGAGRGVCGWGFFGCASGPALAAGTCGCCGCCCCCGCGCCCGRGRSCCGAGAGAGAGRGPGRGPGIAPGRGRSLELSAVREGAGAPPLPFDGPGTGLRPPDFPPGLPPAVNASRSRRATGASTVDDADLTNSPCSLSLARTSLLVTPSSFASSCTRALPATALLNW